MAIIIGLIKIIIVFGIIVGMHEGAHFLMAKKNKIYVKEFAIGFGPKIFSKEKNGTIYSIRAIPFGGFNDLAENIPDEEAEKNKIEGCQYYKNASAKVRFSILIAGVAVNILFAVLLYFTIHLFTDNRTLVVDTVGNEYQAYGIVQSDDEIIGIDGKKLRVRSDLDNYLLFNDPDKVTLTIIRDGVEENVEVPVSITNESGIPRKLIGVTMKYGEKTLKGQIYYSFWSTINFVTRTLYGYGTLITGRASINNFSGPVGIGETVATSKGIYEMCYYLSAISISLGIINLLPIPGLDGGKIMFLIIELIRGKKVNEDVETILSLVCIFLLLMFALYITKNDISGMIVK